MVGMELNAERRWWVLRAGTHASRIRGASHGCRAMQQESVAGPGWKRRLFFLYTRSQQPHTCILTVAREYTRAVPPPPYFG